MKTTARIALVTFTLFAAANAQAQNSTADDQADVWAIVEAQWAAEQKGNRNWIDNMLVDEFVGWERSSPAPRNKASTKMWDRYTDTQGKLAAHELYPLSIVVRGDVAVAHYLYSTASEDKDGEVEFNNGRYTDVLVRTENGWKFVAWHGGDDD
ncbi:MAG: nuclear transport factor 2 family protein [Woeseiaceae bacterium]|nr:nuclear transport factor 2 family protein [Woeseiaceae bacterium]